MRILTLLSFVFVMGCQSVDRAPTITIRSPEAEQIIAGFATLTPRVTVSDDRRDPVRVEFEIDGVPVEPAAIESGCHQGCSIEGELPTDELEDGVHTLFARVTDAGGNTTEAEAEVEFSIFDIPYVDGIAVMDTNEGGLNGPDMEVEVHLLSDETANYLGCASLTEVQQDNVPYDELGVPFIFNEDEDKVVFADVAFEQIRVVVIESDNGEHCPVWPDLTETFESGVDDIYGISPPFELSVLFNDDYIVPVANTTGLLLKRGRPLGAR